MDCAVFEIPSAEESVLPGTTVAVLEERVKNNVQFFWVVVSFLVAWLGVGTYFLVEMRGDVKVLLRPQNLTKAANTPNDPKSQTEATKIIAAAKHGPPIPVTAVQQSGTKFISASEKNTQAWTVAAQLVSYRTTLNSDLLVVGTAEQIATTPGFKQGPSARFFNAPPGLDGPNFTYGGGLPPEKSALMGLLDPNNPRNLGTAPPWIGIQPEVILGEGGALLLDGMVMRHVVLRNVNVFYEGGLTKIEDVVFVNCSFTLKNNLEARRFALSVLRQSEVTFPAPLKQ